MSITKHPKKKLSVAISHNNYEKIKKITRDNKEQSTSSVIDYSLDMSLEEVRELLKNPLQLEEEILKRRLADVQKLKEDKKS